MKRLLFKIALPWHDQQPGIHNTLHLVLVSSFLSQSAHSENEEYKIQHDHKCLFLYLLFVTRELQVGVSNTSIRMIHTSDRTSMFLACSNTS